MWSQSWRQKGQKFKVSFSYTRISKSAWVTKILPLKKKSNKKIHDSHDGSQGDHACLKSSDLISGTQVGEGENQL